MREPSWRRQGEEPDYRFSLANERTLLAWIRTALALLAGGVLLEQFATHLEPHAVLVGLAIGLATLAAVLSATASASAMPASQRPAEPRPASPISLLIIEVSTSRFGPLRPTPK